MDTVAKKSTTAESAMHKLIASMARLSKASREGNFEYIKSDGLKNVRVTLEEIVNSSNKVLQKAFKDIDFNAVRTNLAQAAKAAANESTGEFQASFYKISKELQSAFDRPLTASEKMSNLWTGIKEKIASIPKTLKVAAGIIGAIFLTVKAISALVKNAVDVSKLGDDIDKMSQKVGMTTTAYQKWAYVLERCGIEATQLKTAMRALTRTSINNPERFTNYGINPQNLSQQQLFDATILKLQGIKDSTERARVAYKLFGQSSAELAPLLNISAKEVARLSYQYDLLGATMSGKVVRASVDMQDALTDLRAAWQGLKNTLAEYLIPLITKIIIRVTVLVAKINMFFRAIMGASLEYENIEESTAETTTNIEESVKAVKALKTLISGFDELNIFPSRDNGASIDSGAYDYDFGSDITPTIGEILPPEAIKELEEFRHKMEKLSAIIQHFKRMINEEEEPNNFWEWAIITPIRLVKHAIESAQENFLYLKVFIWDMKQLLTGQRAPRNFFEWGLITPIVTLTLAIAAGKALMKLLKDWVADMYKLVTLQRAPRNFIEVGIVTPIIALRLAILLVMTAFEKLKTWLKDMVALVTLQRAPRNFIELAIVTPILLFHKAWETAKTGFALFYTILKSLKDILDSTLKGNILQAVYALVSLFAQMTGILPSTKNNLKDTNKELEKTNNEINKPVSKSSGISVFMALPLAAYALAMKLFGDNTKTTKEEIEDLAESTQQSTMSLEDARKKWTQQGYDLMTFGGQLDLTSERLKALKDAAGGLDLNFGGNIDETLPDKLKGMTQNEVFKSDYWKKQFNAIPDGMKKVDINTPSTNMAKSMGKALQDTLNALIYKVNNSGALKALQKFGIGVQIPYLKLFAKGGVIDEPTLGLMGEYPGANSNPEIVTPENKLTEIFENSNGDIVNVLVQGFRQIIQAIDEKDTTVKISDTTIAKSAARGNNQYRLQTGQSLF